MKNSELFHYISEILSLRSSFTLPVSSCVCRALSLDVHSFVVALPDPDAISFASELEILLADSPISVTRLDYIPDSARVVFLYKSSGFPLYLHFTVFS